MKINTTPRESRPLPGFLWVLTLGAVGFAAGFFGPIIFVPEANQGPLVGIFISGPGGAFLGVLLYMISRMLDISAARQWRMLWVFSVALVMVTLYFIMPQPELRGYVVEIQVQRCEPPAQSADAAIQYWEKRVAAVTWASPRSGWQDDARQRLKTDPGVVLDTLVVRRNRIYTQRKPWNKGKITAGGWQAASETKSYYAQFAGGSCADYPVGTKSLQFIAYDLSGSTRGAEDWPPRKLADFLDRQTLQPVPDEFRRLIGN